jgi:phage tail-like protein
MIVFACCLLLSGVAAAQTSNAGGRLKATSKTTGDFNLANRFSFEIDGVLVAGVHSQADLNALRTEATTYKDGEDGTTRTRPGNHKPGTIVLAKDWSNTPEWYTWRKAVLDGKTDRRSISVVFYDDAGAETGRLIFYNCWPVKHVMPTPGERSSGHAVETIELAYDSVEWKGK